MKEKPKKFTFKKGKQETGLAGIGNPYPDTDIKLDKMSVGWIDAPTWNTKDNLWRVYLLVKDDSTSGGFRNVRLKATFNEEKEARVWLNENISAILARWELYKTEPQED